MSGRRRVSALTLAVGLLVTACSGTSGEAGPTATTSPSPTTTGDTATTIAPVAGTLDAVALGTQEIAAVDEPTALAARPSSRNLYIAEKGGTVRVVKVTRTEATASSAAKLTYQLQTTPILDLSDELINEGERGLLGLAFSTDGRKLYVDYTAQPDGHTVVAEYELGDRDSIDPQSRRELLAVPQPYANHNGGQLVFGPDGYLYVGLGDGGSGGDPDGRAQDPTELLGSILRIDPEGGSADGPAYAIPAGNPFADGVKGRPEVWIYGVRNPWRFTFDRTSGDLWIGDVGQGDWEEVDHLPAVGGFDAGRGANLGWNEMEGTHPYDGGENPDGAVLPVHDYSHADGSCSVTGGYVYRGEAIAALAGSYLFADYCLAGVRGLQVDGGAVIDQRTFDLPTPQVTSFGEDGDGELFVLLQGGQVLKIVAG